MKKTLVTDLSEPLRKERVHTHQRIALVRFAAVGIFFVLELVLGGLFRLPEWRNDWWFFGSYLALTAVFFWLAKRLRRGTTFLGLAIAFVDVPAVFYLQWMTLPGSPSPSGVAGFTIGIYVFLVILATLALDKRIIWITALSGVIFEVWLQTLAGVGTGAMVASFLLLSLAAAASVYASNRLVDLVGHVARDYEERKRIERQLLLADKLSSMGQIIASVAHEINNPLAYVVVNVDLAKAAIDDLPKRLVRETSQEVEVRTLEIASMLDAAVNGAERLRFLVTDLRKMSRADDDAHEAEVIGVIESSISIAQGEIKERATLERDLQPVPNVLMSPMRLSQVMLNLLVNAAQAIPPGFADVNRVRVRTFANGTSVVIEVGDTGAGISEETRERLFEPFFTTKPAGEGTGLGLSICHDIITQAGGTIVVDSTIGKGTTFRITLPTRAPASIN